jgi:pimeloyl-ACP methyl ester carboxylesterase
MGRVKSLCLGLAVVLATLGLWGTQSRADRRLLEGSGATAAPVHRLSRTAAQDGPSAPDAAETGPSQRAGAAPRTVSPSITGEPAPQMRVDAATSSGTACRSVAVPVTVGGQSGSIAGTLCTPPSATTVQLLVPGWTYNRFYWDLPYQPDAYSYVRAANRAGYATLAIDRLGSGASLHPLSIAHTLQADIRTVHEVAAALRNGSLGSSFSKVVGVGHSLGSIIVAKVAGLHGDFDALVTTGYSHVINYSNAYIEIALRDHMAAGDPKFAASGLDPGYVTSQPGMRARTFHHPPNTDPAMVGLEETLLKDTETLTEAATILAYPLENVDRQLTVPVLVVNGDRDRIFCGLYTADCTTAEALAAHERQFYGPDASVEAYVVEGAGHDLCVETTAHQAAERILEFAERHVGHGDGVVGSAPGASAEIVVPPQGQPSAQIQAANAAFAAAVLPLADAYNALVRPIPGLGDTGHSNPAATALLVQIGNLANKASGNLAQESLEN